MSSEEWFSSMKLVSLALCLNEWTKKVLAVGVNNTEITR
jgi:hypothetical protein